MSWNDINPERILNRPPHPKRMFPPYQQHQTSKLLKRMPNTKFWEIAQANVAKQLLHALGYHSVVDLKTITKMNMIQDNPITKSDIKLMECLYGPDIPTVKGKTTRQHLHRLVSNIVSIPHELCDTQRDVCLYIDIMYINGMPFLATISKNIKYRTAMWVADHMAPTITNLVESVLKLYNRAGFQVM